jgi:hypothetical protein
MRLVAAWTFEILRSRSPQELAAAQTEALRDHLEGVVQSTQRIAQASQQSADEASRKPKQFAGQLKKPSE